MPVGKLYTSRRFHALLQVTAGIKDEVEKSHRALDSIVSLILP